MAPLIELHQVSKEFHGPAGRFLALADINLRVGAGEFVAVVGRSGSGKSTLINMITGIDRPTRGEVIVDNTAIHALAEGPMAQWRGRTVGIVFQFFQLLPTLSLAQNVMLPMDFCDQFAPSERFDRAMHLLEMVGVSAHARKLPAAVSGGEQQRAAVARALANDPPIIAADEPTGNLDSQTAEDIFRLFEKLAADGKTVVMVTHDRDFATRALRMIRLADGRLAPDTDDHGA